MDIETTSRYLSEGDYVSTVEDVKQGGNRTPNIGSLYFPYLIQRTRGNRWVILNRDYKPLGIITSEYVDYDQYAIPLKITAKVANALTYKATGIELTGKKGESIHFYDDGCNPFKESAKKHWPAYQEKLTILSGLKTAIAH